MKQNQDKFAGHRVAVRNKAMDVADDCRFQSVRMESATKDREVMDECTKQAVQKSGLKLSRKSSPFKITVLSEIL